MYIFSDNILTVLHIHTISYLDFNKHVQFFANVDSKCCHRGLKCFSAQVMKIKEDLIAQEPKHREAMEEVWNDMMVGNISKCFALTFPYLNSFITSNGNRKGRKAFSGTFTFCYKQKVDKFSSRYFLGIRTCPSFPPHNLTVDNSSHRQKTTFPD